MIRINLLREEISLPRKRPPVSVSEKRKNHLFIFLLLLSFGAIGFLWWRVERQIAILDRNIRIAEQRRTKLEGIIKEVKTYEEQKKSLQSKLDLIVDLQRNQASPVQLMQQVSDLLPVEIWIESLRQQGDQINLEGSSVSYNAIATFIENLNHSNRVQPGSVNLINAEERGPGEIQFSLSWIFVRD
ncbi:MAG: PilN domain-containing protein [Acidobacteriota bacterium]